MLEPKLLIADEPTTALDVGTQAQVLALLGDLAKRAGTSVLLISHDLALVAGLADRLAILNAGTIAETGPTRAVLAAPTTAYTRALVADFRLDTVPAPAAVAPAPLLEAEGLCRDYGRPSARLFRRATPLRAVDEVSLAIGRGERVALVGESGSGKSSLVRLLLALDAPTHGRVRLAGEVFSAAGGTPQRALRRLVQAVFQDPNGSLNPRHRVARIVAEPLGLLEVAPTAPERAARVLAALSDVGLGADALARYPHEFSGGERQRIALARALVLDPPLLVLDEATSALDGSRRAQILALLGRLHASRGLALLLVTHDLAVARAATTRMLVMQSGRIVESGTTVDVLATPRHPYTRELIAATPDLGQLLGSAAAGR